MTSTLPRLPDDPLAALVDLPGVADAVGGARSAVDGLLSHRLLRRRSAEVTAESALRGARASAELEGAHIELERLRGQLLSGGTVELHDRSDEHGARVVANAVRLHADLGQVLVAWRHSPRQALARLHVLAAAELEADPDRLGRPRPAGVEVDDPYGIGPAPEPVEVAARLDGLARLLTAGTSAPAVVVSAVVHGELLALRPFGVADGLVARAAARLVLIDRGLDPKAVSAPEVGHAELEKFGEGGFARDHGAIEGDSYGLALRGYVGGGPGGVARWVRHCADAVALGAREGLAVCEAVTRAG
ncbi:MAG TPA: oxidoreductase [Mycobacteriales bacterium]|nr:oxidoreductase [Mycobacteriales bacterium]